MSLDVRLVVARGFLQIEDLAPRVRKMSLYFSLSEQSSVPRLLLPLLCHLGPTNDDHRPCLRNYGRTWLGLLFIFGETVSRSERG